jgi:hypothetical protein
MLTMPVVPEMAGVRGDLEERFAMARRVKDE